MSDINGENDINNTVPMFRSLGELFFNSLKKYSDRVFQFIDESNEKTTFSDALRWSVKVAIKLKEKGITTEDIVCCCSHNHKFSAIPFIASQFLGAVICNLHPKLSHLDTIRLLKLTQPKILFVTEESLNFIETCLKQANVTTEIVVFGQSNKYSQFSEYLKTDSEEEQTFKPSKILDNTETAVILFSSGTTGFPKGISLSHRALINTVGREISFDANNISLPDVLLYYPTLYWISGTFSLIRCSLMGFAHVVVKEFDPAYTWTLIEKYKVNSIFLATYDAIDFYKHYSPKVDVSSLQSFMTGSCPVPSTLIGNLREILPHVTILIGYALTETAGVVTIFNTSIPDQKAMSILKPNSVGKMIPGIQWKVVDIDTEEVLGPNREGELRLKYEGYLMNGYFKTDTTGAYDTEGYFKTGDIVSYDEDECFYIKNRIKEIFKYRGWHILPAIIEDVLRSHPAVKEAAVIGVPHETDGELPMALVVLLPEYDQTCVADIKSYVDGQVGDSQKLRGGIRVIDSLPKTPTGKIRRRELQNLVLNKAA